MKQEKLLALRKKNMGGIELLHMKSTYFDFNLF